MGKALMESMTASGRWQYETETAAFLVILIYAVWQDMKYRSLGRRFLLLAGVTGCIFCIGSGREWTAALLSSAVGVVLLGLGFATGGEIGEGDGWFFIITGLFLKPEENFILFLSGISFCSLYSLTLAAAAFIGGGSIGKKKIPFLPYLLPVGLWLALT